MKILDAKLRESILILLRETNLSYNRISIVLNCSRVTVKNLGDKYSINEIRDYNNIENAKYLIENTNLPLDRIAKCTNYSKATIVRMKLGTDSFKNKAMNDILSMLRDSSLSFEEISEKSGRSLSGIYIINKRYNIRKLK